MPVFKRVLCKERVRHVPPQFSWIDHRLVRDGHVSRCSANALALYLFLVTVADAQGLSYYADKTICRLLRLDAAMLGCARGELIANRLIAYQCPHYQVLALDPPSKSPSATTPARTQSHPDRPQPTGPQSIAEILRQLAKPLDSEQNKPFDAAQDKPFDAAQDKPFDAAQDKPFDAAQDKP